MALDSDGGRQVGEGLDASPDGAGAGAAVESFRGVEPSGFADESADETGAGAVFDCVVGFSGPIVGRVGSAGASVAAEADVVGVVDGAGADVEFGDVVVEVDGAGADIEFSCAVGCITKGSARTLAGATMAAARHAAIAAERREGQESFVSCRRTATSAKLPRSASGSCRRT